MLVGVVMGSASDWDVMKAAAEQLEELRRALRGAGALGAPHAGSAGALDRRARRQGRGVLHRRGGRRGAPRRRRRGEDEAPGARRADPLEAPAGPRFAALDGADAEGHPGRHVRDRRGGRSQRGAVRGCDARARASAAARGQARPRSARSRPTRCSQRSSRSDDDRRHAVRIEPQEPALPPPREGARPLCRRRRQAARDSVGPAVGVRRGAAEPGAGEGQGADRALVLLVREARSTSSRTTSPASSRNRSSRRTSATRSPAARWWCGG